MIKNKAVVANLPENIKSIILNKQVFQGIAVVFLTAIFSISISRLGLGLLAICPVAILILVFMQNYELGVICFVLSFAYESAVVFIPEYGLAAIIRLDEIFFASIFAVWFLRKVTANKTGISSSGPLLKPLKFYVLIISILSAGYYDQIGSTPFLGTSITGFASLTAVLFRLSEVVFGYIILSDRRLSKKTRINMFWCLFIAASFAIAFSVLVAYKFFPRHVFSNEYYDPSGAFSRFFLYGNTSSWGVLILIYFFIFFYAFFYFKSLANKLALSLFLTLSLYMLFLSGTKTIMVAITAGLSWFVFKEREKIALNLRMFFLIIFILGISVWGINRYTTYKQHLEIFRHMEQAYIGTGFKGLDKAYSETSVQGRVDAWRRFLEAVKDEPALLLFGRGWQRRAMYPEVGNLHNDFLTAIHDLGILGGIFIIWLYLAMFKQFKAASIKAMEYKERLLVSIMQGLSIAVFISSFMSENFTFYWGIEVQFPLIVAVMAVVWNYLKSFREETG